MHIKKQIIQGAKLATTSIIFLWHRPLLLCFFGIPALASLAITIIGHTLMLNPVVNRYDLSLIIFKGVEFFAHAPQWFYHSAHFFVIYASNIIIIACSVALIIYINSILKHTSMKARTIIESIGKKIIPISIWAFITMIDPSSMQYLITTNQGAAVLFTTMLISGGWALATMMVIPLIALEHASILRAIVGSAYIVWDNLALIIGGQIWLLFLSVLVSLPFASTRLFLGNQAPENFISLFALIALIILRYFLTTAYAVFRAFIYHRIHEK